MFKPIIDERLQEVINEYSAVVVRFEKLQKANDDDDVVDDDNDDDDGDDDDDAVDDDEYKIKNRCITKFIRIRALTKCCETFRSVHTNAFASLAYFVLACLLSLFL